MVLIKPLDYMYDHLINKTLKNISVLLCWANCICCSIEAFGKFYTGNTKSGYSRKNFETFISSYMNGDFYEKKLNKKYYGKILWDDFRNGIAHGFTIKSGGFEHNYNEYFRIEKTNSLLIDPAKFYDDFKKAVNLFCEDLNSDDSKYKTFEKVFEEVFIEGK